MTTDFPASSAPLSPSDERTWAMLAHYSILLNLITGLLGVPVPLVIYFIYKDRSAYVANQAMQAFLFQLLWWIGGGALIAFVWIVTTILIAFLIGLLCIPIAILISFIPLVAIVYGVYGGVKCNQGEDFRYWLVGDWVSGSFTPAP